MNETLYNTPFTKGYIEEICLNYAKDINLLIVKLAIFNLFYFLILRRIINKFPKLNFKVFTIDLNEVLEYVVVIANVFIVAYYLIFNYNTLIINNLNVIWFIVNLIIITIGLLFLYYNREFVKKFWKKIKENIKDMKD